MVETLRQFDTVMTQLQDNTTGEISAQRLRDALYSLVKSFGALYRQGQSGQGFDTDTVVNFNGAVNDDETLANATTERLTIPINGNGYYIVFYGASMALSFSGIGSGQLKLTKNGTDLTSAPQPKSSTNSNESVCLSGVAVVFLAAGDYLQITATKSGSGSPTVLDAHLVAVRLA